MAMEGPPVPADTLELLLAAPPRVIHSASLPNIPPLPIRRATTSHGRLTRLPDPNVSARYPHTPKINLHLPAKASGSRLTGLTGVENKYHAEQWELLRAAPDDVEQVAVIEAAPAGAPPLKKPAVSLDPRLRAKREADYTRALADINSLTLERRNVVELANGRTLAPVSSSNAPAAPKVDDDGPSEAERRAAHARKMRENRERKALAEAKTAGGRVKARLEMLREDANARNELESKVASFKSTRADGKVESRDFVKDNRVALRSFSMGHLIESRKKGAQEWEKRHVDVQVRLAAMESERESIRQAMEQQFFAEQREREQNMRGSPRARPATAGAAGSEHVTPGGTVLAVALKHLPPRERAQILRLEMERRRRWMLLVVLALRASHSLDELVYARNNRHLRDEQDLAAKTIQRKYTAKAMRKNLHLLHKSMGCLRKNTGIFAFKWRMRNKVRAGDALREFLGAVKQKSKFTKAMHNYIWQVIRVQRAWKRHASLIRAQLGLFAVQFDAHVKTKRSVEQFLSESQRRIWLAKISNQMLAAADTMTKTGQREAKRAEAAAPAAAEVVEADAPEDADAPRRQKRRASVQMLEQPDVLPTLAGGKFLQIDLDCKMTVLSHKLLDFHHAHAREVAAYQTELAHAERLASRARQMEAARAVVLGEDAASPHEIEGAADGVADLSALGDFASMVRPRPPARIRIMLNENELNAVVVEALMATADRISKNLPIDDSRSVSAAGSRQY